MPNQDQSAEALRGVRKALESTATNFSSIPFFVRPMVKRGFARRAGMSLETWIDHIGNAIAEIERGGDATRLIHDLEKLAEVFRTAPERASRAMKGAPLETVRKRSRERERAVVLAIEALRGSGD